jgi:hypothetical protein
MAIWENVEIVKNSDTYQAVKWGLFSDEAMIPNISGDNRTNLFCKEFRHLKYGKCVIYFYSIRNIISYSIIESVNNSGNALPEQIDSGTSPTYITLIVCHVGRVRSR